MEQIFLRFVNYSLVAGWLILAVLAARLLLKRAPKWITCLLWALVAVRLVFPFSIESAFSLVPSAKPIPEDFVYTATPRIDSGLEFVDVTLNPVISAGLDADEFASANPSQNWSFVLSLVWVAGVTLMLLYGTISTIVLQRKLSTATLYEKGVKQTEAVKTPFVMGIFKPVIYIPYNIPKEELKYVIAHEKAHIQRKDILWKPLGFLILSFYWFNPLVWVAYIFLCKDIEAACDEKVIKNLEVEERRGYSTALLKCSISGKRITACPVAFGESNVKTRVKGVMNYKKPGFWILIVAVAACVVVGVCFLTDPKKEIEEPEETVASVSEVEIEKEAEPVSEPDSAMQKMLEMQEKQEAAPEEEVYEMAAEPKWNDFGFKNWPLPDGIELTSEWNIITQYWRFVAPKGTEVYAVEAGTVSEGYNFSEGNYIDLIPASNPDMCIRYSHLSEQLLSGKTDVKAGEKIGTVGATGLATGPFLKVAVFDSVEASAKALEGGRDYIIQKPMMFGDAAGLFYCDYSRAVEDDQIPITVYATTRDGKVLWNSEIALPHMGWNSFYYYTDGEKDYIIEYNPSESQGIIGYWFKMFSLDEEGNVTMKCEFYANSESEIDAFNENIAPYLEKAELLISTLNFKLVTGQ